MASIPAGALILSLEEAVAYFPQWSAADRARARDWIDATGVTKFYVPPSGGYVAGHGGPNRSAYRDMPVNGLVMHVGFIHAWPNDAEVDGDERIPLSNFRESNSRDAGPRGVGSGAEPQTCPTCYLLSPGHLNDCENCGHDFVAARRACAARHPANRPR